MNYCVGRTPATEVIQPVASKFSAVIVVVCVELMFVLADLWRSSARAVTVVICLDICIEKSGWWRSSSWAATVDSCLFDYIRLACGVARLGLSVWPFAWVISTWNKGQAEPATQVLCGL